MSEGEPQEPWETREQRLNREDVARRAELDRISRTAGEDLIARMLRHGGFGMPAPPRIEERSREGAEQGPTKAVSLEKNPPVVALEREQEEDSEKARKKREAAALELSRRLFKGGRGDGDSQARVRD